MKIIAMGYVGTGSSAIVHLLKEYEKVSDIDSRNYEHNVLYVPHGIFDLEDSLLKNNTMEKSDVAINDFYHEMKNLNDNDYGWFGGFSKKFGSEFMNNVNEFINGLVIYSRNGGWSYDYRYKLGISSLIKDIVKFLLRKPISKFGQRIDITGDDNKVNFAFPTAEEFYSEAKQFVDKYFRMIGCVDGHTYIFDQLLKPQQLYRINNYFDDDIRFIVVDRDPRDTFLLNKYIWSDSRPYYLTPPNVNDFIEFYSRHYKTEKFIEDKRILRIHFEDLIYDYENTVSKIEDFIGKENIGEHIYTRQFFNPDISIKNTQIFNINPLWKNEVESFATSELSNHIYEFPYEVNSNVKDVTDPDPDTSVKKKI